MSKRNIYFCGHSENPPQWYWINGLHDACILQTEAFEFPFDYRTFAKDRKNYNRNMLLLKINSESAIYDNTVEEIRFLNYKILSEGVSLEGRENVWWLADRLVNCGDYYILEIDLQDEDFFTVEIKFDRAEVSRK